MTNGNPQPRPMFAPAAGDHNQWSTEGVGHSSADLEEALRRALLYYDADHDDIPDTTVFHERLMGQRDGLWYICDRNGFIVSDGPEDGLQVEGAPVPITVATLVPEPEPAPEPDATDEVAAVGVWEEIQGAQARLAAAGPTIADGTWDDIANLHQLAAPFGRVATTADLARRGDIGGDVALANLREALLETAAVAASWAETIDHA